MKFLMFSLVVIMSPYLSNGQVTITKKNFPQPEDTYPTQTVIIHPDDLPWRLFDTTKAYFNVDVSNMGASIPDTQRFERPSRMGGGNDVSSAEFGVTTSFGNVFFKRNGDVLEIVGISPQIGLQGLVGFEFDKPLAYLATPLSYPDTYRDSANSSRNLIVVKVDVKMIESYEVNGYGRMRIPGGKWFDAIRIKRRYDFVITTKPTFGDETVQEGFLVNWEFYSDSVVHSVLRADTRIVNNGQDTQVVFVFSDKSLPVGLKEIEINEQSYRKEIIAFTNKVEFNNWDGKVQVYGLSGQLVGEGHLDPTKTLDLFHLPKGVYIATGRSGNATVKQKLLKY